MANRTADYNYVDRNRNRIAVRLTNAVQVYKGSLIGLDTTTGLAVKWADSTNTEFLGIATGPALGDTSADVPPEVEIDISGVILQRVPVTGVSDITSQGAEVNCATDNPEADLKLAANTNTDQIGQVIRWHSSTTCDVMLYTPAEHLFI